MTAATATGPAWRGVVLDGHVWAWPTLLLAHNDAFAVLPVLAGCSCRWRQWDPGGTVEFDPGTTDEDKARVLAWIEAVS